MQQISRLAGSALLLIGMLNATAAEAFFGNMMNPSRWFGGDRDYDDYYYDGPGPAYGPGYYGAPMGYGAPGYAPPVYAAPAYGYAPPAQTAPANTNNATSDEIRQLKERIEQLEQEQAAGAYGSHPGSYPAATPARQHIYNAPVTGQSAPGGAGTYRPPSPAAASPGDHAAPPATQAAPARAAGQQQPPPAGEWRPAGYYHPNMQ